MKNFCPGAKLIRQPAPEIFKCPNCGEEVEIWTDELRGKCSKCGTVVIKDQEQSCLEWCKMAKECVGEETYNNFMRNRSITLKEALIEELEQFFGEDKKRIDHARKVLEFAEEILKNEKGDYHIVIPAAILHDVGIKIAEEKYGSSDGKLQEKEGPPVAEKILLKHGVSRQIIDEVCEIIAHHHTPGVVKTLNFSILYDANMIVNLGDIANDLTEEKIDQLIKIVFLTDTGRKIATRELLKKKNKQI